MESETTQTPNELPELAPELLAKLSKVDKALALMAQFNRAKPGSLFTGAQLKEMHVGFISVGVPAIDRLLGGGLPRGMITHLFGPKSSGKSTLSLQAAAAVHREDPEAVVLVVNFEGYWSKFSIDYIESFGVDMSRTIIIPQGPGEDSLWLAQQMIASNLVDLVIVDSVAGVKSKKEIEKELDKDARIAARANLIERFITNIIALMSPKYDEATKKLIPNRTAILLLNQLRSSIDAYADHTPGGNAIQFFSAIEIHVKANKEDFIYFKKDKDQLDAMVDCYEKDDAAKKVHIGKKLSFTAKKQRINGMEGRVVNADFYYRRLTEPSPTGFVGFGYDVVGNTVEEAILRKVIEQNGTWYRYGEDIPRIRGKEKLIAKVRGSAPIKDKLLGELYSGQ